MTEASQHIEILRALQDVFDTKADTSAKVNDSMDAKALSIRIKAAAEYIERMDKLLRDAPHADNCARWDVEPTNVTGFIWIKQCNCWKREIDAPGEK